MSSEQLFLLIPSIICLTIGILLLKKGIYIKYNDPLSIKKGELYIQACVSDWKRTFYRGRVRYYPCLTYEIAGIIYTNKSCCYVGYPEEYILKHPIGSHVMVIGRLSNFGIYKSECGGYMFELCDHKEISFNKNGIYIICIIVATFFLLGGLSMLLGAFS